MSLDMYLGPTEEEQQPFHYEGWMIEIVVQGVKRWYGPENVRCTHLTEGEIFSLWLLDPRYYISSVEGVFMSEISPEKGLELPPRAQEFSDLLDEIKGEDPNDEGDDPEELAIRRFLDTIKPP